MKPSEAIKELVKKWENISPGYDNPNIEFQDDSTFISDLTALISEHYVAKAAYIALENTLAKAEAKNLELLQQRDELKEALILAEGLIDMASDKEWAKIRAAIKNTKDETDTIQR